MNSFNLSKSMRGTVVATDDNHKYIEMNVFYTKERKTQQNFMQFMNFLP